MNPLPSLRSRAEGVRLSPPGGKPCWEGPGGKASLPNRRVQASRRTDTAPEQVLLADIKDLTLSEGERKFLHHKLDHSPPAGPPP